MANATEPPRRLGIELISDEELRRELRVSRETLWRWRTRRRRPLPFLRLGAKVVYDLRQVERWIRDSGKAAV